MRIVIPIKPISINQAFKGRRYKTDKCKKFEWDLWQLLKNKPMLKGTVEIEYHFYLKNHKLADYDNMIKVLQDILVKKGYIEDDRKIYHAEQYKIPSKDDGINIIIRPYDVEQESKKFGTVVKS